MREIQVRVWRGNTYALDYVRLTDAEYKLVKSGMHNKYTLPNERFSTTFEKFLEEEK